MQNQWQPIENAPKDGTKMLLWDTDREEVVIGSWSRSIMDGFSTHDWYGDELLENGAEAFYKPSHWMPLPPAPTHTEG